MRNRSTAQKADPSWSAFCLERVEGVERSFQSPTPRSRADWTDGIRLVERPGVVCPSRGARRVRRVRQRLVTKTVTNPSPESTTREGGRRVVVVGSNSRNVSPGVFCRLLLPSMESMRLVHLMVENFRGIHTLLWALPAQERLLCLVGPCDARKTTVLEAIELALSDRWAPQLTDADFYNGDLSRPIVIEATVGALPGSIESDDSLGHWMRGWDSSKGAFVADPEEDHEAVLTIRLEIDGALEPTWTAVKPGVEPRRVGAELRGALGASWLGDDPERHLTWMRNSSLWRTTERAQTKPLLASAFRAARSAVAASAELDAFNLAAGEVQKAAADLGLHSAAAYTSGLDPRSSRIGSGMLALHVGAISALQSGLGTRRLLALAVQRTSVPEGALLLIDEIEHGLEPHRLRRVVATLRSQAGGTTDAGSSTRAPVIGQALLTTHSPVAVVELNATELQVVRERQGVVTITAVPPQLQDVVRRGPEAFLARKVVVCEGKTEVGLLRALDGYWTVLHDGAAMAACGVALVDGGGSSAPSVARKFASLGYATALWLDADDSSVDAEVAEAATAGVHVVRWADQCCTEARIARDVPLDTIGKLVAWATVERGKASVLDSIRGSLKLNVALPGETVAEWVAAGLAEEKVRVAVAQASKGWYKLIEPAEQVGGLVREALPSVTSTDLFQKLKSLETWVYGE